MHYPDAVYGPVYIDEPVLLDLINSSAFQRLAHILQHSSITGFLGITQHERMKGAYLEQSDIPPILARYGCNWQDFIDEDA